MANYKVFLNDGRTLYQTDVTAAWVNETVKSKPYRRQFGMASAKQGPGAGATAWQTLPLKVVDPTSIPASVDHSANPDMIILDDDMAGNAHNVDDVSSTFRRYTKATGGATYDVPLWNFAGESDETEA